MSPLEAGDFVSLRIHTDSPIDLTALRFDPWEDENGETRHGPWLRYSDARDRDGKRIPVEDHTGKPIFEIPLSYDMTTYPLRSPAIPAQPFVSQTGQNLSVTAIVDARNTDAKGTVTFAAKSRGRLLGKQQVTIANGGIHQLKLDASVAANEPVFFSFSVDDPDLFETVRTSISGAPGAVSVMRYGVAHPSRLSFTLIISNSLMRISRGCCSTTASSDWTLSMSRAHWRKRHKNARSCQPFGKFSHVSE